MESREELRAEARKRYTAKNSRTETREELRREARKQYEPKVTQEDVNKWFSSSESLLRSAQNRLSSSENYQNWKSDKGQTANSVNQRLKEAREVEHFLTYYEDSLGEEQYNRFMTQYSQYLSQLQQASNYLGKETEYYSDVKNENVLRQMSSKDINDSISTLEKEKEEKGGTWAKKLMSMITGASGLKSEHEKYKKAAEEAENRQNKIDTLKTEEYNRKVAEQLEQLDEETKSELMKVPEYEYNLKRMNIAHNNEMVSGYNQKISAVKEKIKEKGFDPDDLIHYAEMQYNSKSAESFQEEMEKFGEEHPILSSAASVPASLASGLGYADALAQNVRNAVSDDYRPVDYNRIGSVTGQMSDSIRAGVMDRYDWNIGNWDAFDFLYGTGMSGLDSLAAGALGSVVGGAASALGVGAKTAGRIASASGGSVLGLSAANSTMRDVKSRGGNDNQAIMSGAVAGIFESLFETVSIGNFNKLKEVDPKSIKDVAMNILKSAGVNFSEEAATEAANIAYDTLANGDISNYKLMIAAYMKDGCSESEAKSKAAANLAGQVFEAGAGGALMGVGFGALGSGIGYVKNRANGTAVTGKTVVGFDGGSQTKIVQQLESLGMDTQEAVKLSPVVQKQISGEKLTRAEKNLLGGSEKAQNLAAQLADKSNNAIDTPGSPDMETVKKEYQKAVNPKIIDFVNKVRGLKNKDAASKVNIELAAVTEREAQDIKKLTNIDVSEFKRSMDGNAVEHIDKRHGENGAADRSMSDINDLARIEYVLKNYDSVDIDGNESNKSRRYNNADNSPAQQIEYRKRVNGNYYVVEAVPDSKAKTLRIVSAYKTKAEGVSQVLNMPESPQLTSETPHAFAPSDNNVAQTKSYVKSVPATVDGRSVTVSGIDRIETSGNRAQMYVKTADGESVALSDVNFGNRETEAIYNFAQGFESTNTARAFVTGYNQGDSANDYMNAFLDFRSAGMAGRDFDSVLQSNANKYGNLEMSQLRQAYYAGVNEKNNAPKQYSAKEEKRAEKNGGLLRNYTKKLNSEQAGSVYVLEALAKKYGFVVEVCDTIADGMANGEYDPKTGRIKIALDAEENAYLRTAGHELYHYIEDWNSTAAGELREYVIGKLKESENYDYDGRVKELQKLYEGFGKADIEAEIVAESMFDVFDEKTIRELVNENRPLAVKIQSWIRGFLESIEKALTALGLKSPEVRALEGDTEALEKISGMFKSALEGAKENKGERSEKSYSLKNETEEKTWYDYSVSFEQQIEDFEKGKLPKRDTLIVCPTPEKMQNVGFNPLPMTYATGHLKTVLQGGKADHDFGKAVLKQIPEAIKNPVAVIASKSHSDTSTVAILDMQYNEKSIVCAVVIDGYGQQNNKMIDSNAITSIHTRQNAVTGLLNDAIEDESAGNVAVYYIDAKKATGLLQKAGLQLPRFLFRTDGYIHSIRDSDSSVKPKFENVTKSQQFKRWFGDWEKKPNTASKIVNEDGTPKIIYHQTAAEFNVFSNANPLAGRNDSETPNGFFAKDNDADIGVGGDKQMALYGDMKKPLHFKDRAEASEWYSKHIDGYKVLAEKLNKLDEEYQSKYDAQETANDEYYEQNYEAYVADDAKVTKAILANEEKLDDILERWKEATNAIRGEQRELLNNYFINNDSGYDGIILDFDGRRSGENVKSYIFFKNTQIKSATDNIGLFDKKNPDIRYSLKNTSSIEEQNKKLVQENESLRKYTKELEREMGLNKKELDERAIRRLSGQILREYSSVYDKNTLTQNLKNVFEYIANADELNFDDVFDRTAEVAKAVIEDSDVINDRLWQEYSELIKQLRTTSISLSTQQKNEIAHYYGSYETFRRQNLGRIRFSEGGIRLEDLWGELCAQYPELFKEDTHELEQAMVLADTYNELRPYHENPFGMNIDAEAYDLAMRIYEEYYNMPELKNLRQRIEQEYRERYEKREAEIREQEAKKRNALTEQLAKQKAMYEQRTFADRNERLRKEAVATHRRSIEKNTKTLNRWLQKPDKTRHVPEALRSVLGDFLTSLDVYGESRSNEALEWRQSMLELKSELEKVQSGKDEQYRQFLADLDPDLFTMMTTVMETYKGCSVREMDAQGLAELDTIVQQIRGGIQRANNLLANSRYETVHELANASINEMDQRKAYNDKVKIGYKKLNVDMLDSFSFFHQLGSAAETVLKSIRSGFDERVNMIANANDFMSSIVSQNEIGKWERETHDFEVAGGKITLTTSQMMEIYNLSKREQAQTHLLIGGIRPQDTATKKTKERVKEKFGKGKEEHSEAVQVTVEDIGEIIDALTPKQKLVAEKMQKFLSSNVADWGNKASMTLYGYRKFTEKNYWPIQVNKNSVRTLNADESAVQAQPNFYKLINIGATKAIQKDASNGLLVKGVFDTFTKHVTEMSAYSAFAVPITDAMKWYNSIDFNEKEDGHVEISGTKQSIERAFGQEGKKYFEKFILDLNGSTDSLNAGGVGEEKLIRNFKIAAVGANLRVAVQQPTAYLRAASEMDMKYLVRGLLSLPASKEAIEKSPIAKWKSWGFYETNMGITMKQLITGQQTKTEWIRDKSMWLAGKGDEITWGALWNACKAEIKDTTDLQEGTEEFDTAVSDRLSEIVDKTQVVDSVLHRSQILRDKSSFAKMLSAFKSEPTKSYNMLRNALVDFKNAKTDDAKKSSRKKLARVAVVHIATSILTAGVAAVADAFRNDDDEKKWLELYLSAFGGNIADNVNPLSAVPYVGDVLSLLQGYSVERTDLAGIQELIETCETWYKFFIDDKQNRDVWKLIKKSAQGVSKVSGIPLSNVLRTFESIYNFFSKDNLGKESDKQEYAKLVKSIQNGESYKKAYNKLAEKGYTQSQIENGIRDILVMSDSRIAQAALARSSGRITEYRSTVEEMTREGYPQNSVIGAINNYMTKQSSAAKAKAYGDDDSFDKYMEALLESGYDEDEIKETVDDLSSDFETNDSNDTVEDKPLYEYKDLKNTVRNGEVTQAQEIVQYLRDNGKEDKNIKQTLTTEFKPEYQELYRQKDYEGMKQMRITLFNLNVGYDTEDFQKWIKDMEK